MFLTKTFAIRDVSYYDSQTVDKSKIVSSKGTGTLSYSDNGVTVHSTTSNNEALWTINGLTLPNEYELEITASNRQGEGTGILLGDEILIDLNGSSPSLTVWRLQSGSYSTLTSLPNVLTDINIIKVRVELGTLKIYNNSNLLTTVNYTPTGSFKYRSYGNNRYTTFKDLTIQEL